MVTEGKEAKAQFNFLYNTSASIAAGLSNDSWPVIEAVVWTFVSPPLKFWNDSSPLFLIWKP